MPLAARSLVATVPPWPCALLRPQILSGHRRTPWTAKFHASFPNILASGGLAGVHINSEVMCVCRGVVQRGPAGLRCCDTCGCTFDELWGACVRLQHLGRGQGQSAAHHLADAPRALPGLPPHGAHVGDCVWQAAAAVGLQGAWWLCARWVRVLPTRGCLSQRNPSAPAVLAVFTQSIRCVVFHPSGESIIVGMELPRVRAVCVATAVVAVVLWCLLVSLLLLHSPPPCAPGVHCV